MIQEIMHFISKHTILSILWIILLISLITLIFKELYAKTKEITCIQAIQLINKKEAIIIDLRSNNEFNKGHIINSINLISNEINDNSIERLEKYKQKPAIIVSENGIEAIKPTKQLIQYGFEHVFILKKGITGWSKENLPLVHSKK